MITMSSSSRQQQQAAAAGSSSRAHPQRRRRVDGLADRLFAVVEREGVDRLEVALVAQHPFGNSEQDQQQQQDLQGTAGRRTARLLYE